MNCTHRSEEPLLPNLKIIVLNYASSNIDVVFLALLCIALTLGTFICDYIFIFFCLFFMISLLHLIVYVMSLQLFQFFPLCHPLPRCPPTPSGYPHTIVHVHGSCKYILWLLYSICCTLYPHDYSVTTNLYFLVPSAFSLFPQLPSHQATIKAFPVSMILFLFCWLVYFVFKFNHL